MDDACFRPLRMPIHQDGEREFPPAAARIYVANGKPVGACQRVPCIKPPETLRDRISYGALIRAESSYVPSAKDRRLAGRRGAKKRWGK